MIFFRKKTKKEKLMDKIRKHDENIRYAKKTIERLKYDIKSTKEEIKIELNLKYKTIMFPMSERTAKQALLDLNRRKLYLEKFSIKESKIKNKILKKLKKVI